jgi:hypothetical protein
VNTGHALNGFNDVAHAILATHADDLQVRHDAILSWAVTFVELRREI